MNDKERNKKYSAPKLNDFKNDMSSGCSWGLIFGIMPWDKKVKLMSKKKDGRKS